MSTILEALAVIKGKDATGSAFDSIANKIKRLSRVANSVNRDIEKQISMGARAESAASRLTRASSSIGTGVRGLAAAGAAYEGSNIARRAVEKTVKAASDRAHEEVRMTSAGMSDAEIAEVGEVVQRLSKKFKPISETNMLHAARNIRSVVGSVEEAVQVLDPLMKLRVVAEGAHPDKKEELNADFDKLIKGMEIKGVTQDHHKFEHYIDGMAKAVNVFGDTLRPTDYYEMFKYGRAATTALSDHFMLSTAPTLAQELGGSSAGKALSSFYTQFVGGKMSNKALAQLEQYGLLTDRSKVIKTSTGNVKGVLPGAIEGQEFLQPGATDPYRWVNEVLIPKLAAKGVTDPGQIQEVIAAMASQQTAAQMMAIFATQQSRITKDANLIKGAKGIESADDIMKRDPKILRSALEAQADNVFSKGAEPLRAPAIAGLNLLNEGLASLRENIDANPSIRAGGILGTALAASLGAEGGMHALGTLFGKGGSSFAFSKFLGSIAPMLMAITTPNMLDEKTDPERYRRLTKGLPRHYDKFARLTSLDDDDKLIDRTDFGDGSESYVAGLKAKNAALRASLEKDLTDLGYAGPGVPGRGQMGFTIDDIRAATGIGSKEPVKAEVVGEATLTTKVEVSPSPDFLTRISQQVQNGINAFRSAGAPSTGTAGSTGRSMPEAGAPQ